MFCMVCTKLFGFSWHVTGTEVLGLHVACYDTFRLLNLCTMLLSCMSSLHVFCREVINQ